MRLQWLIAQASLITPVRLPISHFIFIAFLASKAEYFFGKHQELVSTQSCLLRHVVLLVNPPPKLPPTANPSKFFLRKPSAKVAASSRRSGRKPTGMQGLPPGCQMTQRPTHPRYVHTWNMFRDRENGRTIIIPEADTANNSYQTRDV